MRYLFETERMGFRPMVIEDAGNLFKLDGDPEVRSFFPDGPLTQDEVLDKIRINQEWFHECGFSAFIIEDKRTQTFMGRGGICPFSELEIEAGYVFLKEFWGQGFATEALKGILNWGFENIQNSDTIIAFAPMNHIASHKVMEKNGMVYFKNIDYKGVPCKCFKIEKA